MRTRLVIVFMTVLGALSCSGRPLSLPKDRTVVGAPPPYPYGERALEAGGIVTASDPAGRPRFIRAIGNQAAPVGQTPEAAARAYFARFAPAYGILGDTTTGTDVASVGRTPNGDYLVRLQQRIGGIELYRGEVKVVMRSDLSLVGLTGTASDLTGAKPADQQWALTPGQAMARALAQLYGVPVPEGATVTTLAVAAPYVWLDLPEGSPVRLSQPARAKKVYYRAGNKLTAAYFVETFSSRADNPSSKAHRSLVAASDGRLLERHDLTEDVAFTYRVFAESTGDRRPLDGPIADFTPHPTGTPDGTDPAFVPSVLVQMETFKTRPLLALDPWLPGGAVQTLGNNVDAYADLSAPDGFSNGDLRATTTAAFTFDRAYDVTLEPRASSAQTMAATTNLFYLTNWLHDYWYDSGFDEVAGNAQANNFGRGGLGGDPIHAEAQDFGGVNNANMSTPADGLSPRMQMYLWSPPEKRSLTIEPGGDSLAVGSAAFGPGEFDVTGQVLLVVDGTAPTGDACQPITNDVAGKIALVDRGACSFVAKAVAAEAAGAIAVIIANNVAGPPLNMANSTPPTVVGIPAMGLSLDDGNKIKALFADGEGEVTLHMLRQLQRPGRDGSIDNMVMAHEWGHYFHHRLSDCSTFQCGALSEGWADFVALHTTLRAGDRLDGTYGAGIYAPRVFGDSGYFGIRRFPYSVDPTKNALTLGHVQDAAVLPAVPTSANGNPNSEVHNAGEVWTSMLFEAYVTLQKSPGTRTFDEVRRAFANYLVLGLQLAPANATFTETRDAILTAISMVGPADLQPVADAFARRGAGSCAVSPPADASDDLAPVTESFGVQPNIAITAITIDDSVESCDSDGILDGGETGRVTVTLANKSPAPVGATQLSLTTPTAGVLFPEGASTTVAGIAPFGTATVSLNLALADTVAPQGILTLTVTASNGAACVTSVAEVRTPRIAADEVPGSSATEDVEAREPPWSKSGAGAIWTRAALTPTSHAWHGADSGSDTDSQLVSPPLQVSPTADLQISFDHAFSFEFDTDIFFDGGVIEVSSDDGATWRDISAFADPGYNATLFADSGNPLGGRAAYGATSAAFPAFERVALNLGRALAGQTVRLRFRLTTDDAGDGPGWTIDNIAFQGLVNKPFTSVVDHAGHCQEPPIARAGADRSVDGGVDVILNGSASRDPNGDPLTYHWAQIGGRTVKLLNADRVVAAFRAPRVSRTTVLTFELTVSDQASSSSDTVRIKVRPRNWGTAEPPPDPEVD